MSPKIVLRELTPEERQSVEVDFPPDGGRRVKGLCGHFVLGR